MPDDNSRKSISVIGLPASGKTTFLAATWHLIRSRKMETKLRFTDLKEGTFEHLNTIEARWLDAKEQDRTQVGGMRTISMKLADPQDEIVRLTFPDVPGEDFQRMWENREISDALSDTLSSGAIAMLVNGNTIDAPNWVYDEVALSKSLGIPLHKGEPIPWQASLAPTQVQLVDLLQNLRAKPLDCGERRLVIFITAWDKAAGERKDPTAFLKDKLPLLDQYLSSGRDGWQFRVYGLSAQGGEYDSLKSGAKPRKEAAKLRALDVPSERIQLVDDNSKTHDITEALEWLIS